MSDQARTVWGRVFDPAVPSEARQVFLAESNKTVELALDLGGSKTRPHTVRYGRVILSGFIS